MKTSQNGINLIKKFEGCRLKAYKCPSGIWTIGYGHTSGVKSGQVITKSKAEDLLKKDLETFEKGLKSLVKASINQNQFDALVSFSYNCGLGALQRSTLLRKLNARDYSGAANEFLRWNKSNGKVLDGLTNRRRAERDLFLKSDIYIVKKGDTLSKIAKEHNTTIKELVKKNNIKNPDLIYIGQEIKL